MVFTNFLNVLQVLKLATVLVIIITVLEPFFPLSAPEISLSPDGSSRDEFFYSDSIGVYHSIDPDELTREPPLTSGFRPTNYSGDL